LTRLAALLMLASCTMDADTVAPDTLTLYGGRDAGAWDARGFDGGFDEKGYSYGASLGWNLNSTHTEAERQMVQLDRQFMKLIEAVRESRPQVTPAAPTSVTVEYGPPVPPDWHPAKEEDQESITIKGTMKAIGVAAAALALAIMVRLSKSYNRKAKPKAPEKHA
jgi:hypothetical protein